MHSCLLIPEILKHIFSDIHGGPCGTDPDDRWDHSDHRPDWTVSRRSLAALARVCRPFKDIALDVLWTELEDLEPLFTCFPQDLWTLTCELKLVIRRPVTTKDWSIFERYASRVRVLGHMNSTLFRKIDAEFVHAVMSFSSQSLLLPNLQALCCNDVHGDVHSCMRYLLGPNLVSLHLLFHDGCWTNIMSSLLSGLSRHSARLEVIELETTPPEITELALCGLPHLRQVSLTTTSLSSETLSHLSRLAGLQILDIRILTEHSHYVPSVQSQFCTSSLDMLAISSSTLTFTGDMVQGWVVPCKHLTLESESRETALVVERALHKLHNRLLCDTLESIIIHGSTLAVNNIDYAFNLGTFTPLMQFSNLKKVDLSSFCMSLLDDDTFGSIVKSWPRLESLNLGTTGVLKIPPKITFQGLVTLLSSCPNLRDLALIFDATKVDPPTAQKPGGGVCNTHITSFDVGWSPIGQPLPVAVALSEILPCLSKIEFEFESGFEFDDEEGVWVRKVPKTMWKEVSEYMNVLTLARRQESLRV
ncbi:hypothetical protein DFH29DRAFT_1003185 [Suillus ampliporus]|nr:hypothetical protein DFH29DRAFT_1003185 [Suillus ampliporus]